MVSPEASLRMLHVQRDAAPLKAATHEEDTEDTEATLADLLTRAGFTGDRAQELQWHRIRWLLMGQEEFDRRELNSLLDELEQRAADGDCVFTGPQTLRALDGTSAVALDDGRIRVQ